MADVGNNTLERPSEAVSDAESFREDASITHGPTGGIKADLLEILNSIKQSDDLTAEALRDLRGTLREWRREYATEPAKKCKFIYLLDGKYDAGKCSVELGAHSLSGRHPGIDLCLEEGALKGRDAVVVDALKDACEAGGFGVFLASLERGKMFAKHDKGEEVHADAVRLARVFGLDGCRVAEHIRMAADEIVQSEQFLSAAHDDGEHEDHKHGSLTDREYMHWWRRTVSPSNPFVR